MRPPLALAALIVVAAIGPAVAVSGATAAPSSQPIANDSDVPNATVTALYRGHADLWADLDSTAAAAEARRNGSLEHADPIVPGELLVVALDSSALVEQLHARPEATETARFLALLNETDASLTVRQLNPSTMRPAKAFPLAPNATRVVATNATTYVLIDTEAARLRWADEHDATPTPKLYGGEVFGARFHVGSIEHERLRDGPRARFVEAEARLARAGETGRPLVGASGDTLTVHASTAPGSRVSVRVFSDSGETRFETVTPVTSGGRVRVAVPDDALAPGRNVTVSVRPLGYGAESERYQVRTVRTAAHLGPSTVREEAVRLRDTRLAAGGFLVLTDASGSVLVVERHRPGDRLASLRFPQNADVALGSSLTITAYRDSNGDGSYGAADEPYRVNGTAVNTTVTYNVSATATDTPTATPLTGTQTPTPPTRTPTATGTGTPTSTRTETPGQTGFGVFAALTALAVVAWRRRAPL